MPSIGLDMQVATCLSWADVSDVFKALADPTRRLIMDELRDRGEQTLFELCVRLTSRRGVASTRQAISQHLGVLEEAGLVITRRQGRTKLHDLDPSPLHIIIDRWPPRPRKEQS